MVLELEIENKFRKIAIDDLSNESIFKCFFFGNRKIVFIIDSKGTLYGIITLGDFLKKKGHIRSAVNKQYLFVRSGEYQHMLIKAQEIYDTYKIASDIPVIDENKILVGCIHNNSTFDEYKKSYDLTCSELKNSILNYQSSYYYKKEIDAFSEIIGNTVIYVKDCRIIRELTYLLGSDISKKFIMLNEFEYYNKIMSRFQNKLEMEEKTCLLFDFDLNNHSLLCEEIYSIEKFKMEFEDFVEKGEFSRLLRITQNPYYALNEYICDHDLKDISYPSNRLSTKFLYDYFTINGHPVFLDDSNDCQVIRGSWMINGIRGRRERADSFSACDMVGQQIILNKILEDKSVNVFNIQGATKARLTKGERKRYQKYPNNLGVLIKERDYESINQLFGDDYGKNAFDFVTEVSGEYPVIRRFECDLIVNVDRNSAYINFENGIRKTWYQPEQYINTIYVVGPCFALGPFVEDQDTIPSLLAKILIENGYCYRVVNLGILVSNDIQDVVRSLTLQEGDIVVNLFSTDHIQLQDFIEVIYTDDRFNNILERKDMFFDMPAHCNRRGNEVYAKIIYEQIQKQLKKEKRPMQTEGIYHIYKANSRDLEQYGFTEYKRLLEKERERIPKDKKEIGSIVMNGNPFTCGHEFLIDYALKNCEWLYLFVVQENQSFFQFRHRFDMITENCSDKKNISILRSGKMIASNITIPEYFKRETLRDDTRLKQDIKINAVLDFRLFASYIVPILGIKKRFVGEEPLDLVTRQYNERMKNVLSSFGIEVIEIPRRTLEGGKIISASAVRALYKERKFEELKELVPDATYNFLMQNVNQYL